MVMYNKEVNAQTGEETIRELTAEEVAATQPTEASVRSLRDEILAQTDWWATSDRTMTQAEIDYRQALRDVPAQAGFPENVTWPTKP
jgi:hypothetical protein